MDFYTEDSSLRIRAQVGFGSAYFQDIDEVFAAVGEFGEAFFCGEVFDLYVFAGLFAFGFECFYLFGFAFDLFA